MKNKNISNSFNETLNTSDLKNIGTELSEVILDNVLEEGLLKEIPIFSTLQNIYKSSCSISDLLFTKKLIGLINGFSEVEQFKRKKVIEKIENDPKYNIRVGEKLLYIVDKTEDYETAKAVGKWSKSLFEEKINYEDFLRGIKGIQNLSKYDLECFLKKTEKQIEVHIGNHEEVPILINELNSINFITYIIRTKRINGTQRDSNAKQYSITRIGNLIRQELK